MADSPAINNRENPMDMAITDLVANLKVLIALSGGYLTSISQ